MFVCVEQKIQAMEEKRIERMGESLKTFAEVDRQILPIIGKCLDGITQVAESIEPKNVSNTLMQTHLWQILIVAPLSVLNTSCSFHRNSIWAEQDITEPITDSNIDPGSISGCLLEWIRLS